MLHRPALRTGLQRKSFRGCSRHSLPAMTFPMKPNSGQDVRQSITRARLRKHADFQRAYAAARKRQSASMSWFLAPQSAEGLAQLPAGPRVGLTVPKALGKAHDRNRIKRRMREALRRHVGLLPYGFDLILHPRRGVLSLPFVQLEAETVRVLEQARREAARTCASSSPEAAP